MMVVVGPFMSLERSMTSFAGGATFTVHQYIINLSELKVTAVKNSFQFFRSLQPATAVMPLHAQPHGTCLLRPAQAPESPNATGEIAG